MGQNPHARPLQSTLPHHRRQNQTHPIPKPQLRRSPPRSRHPKPNNKPANPNRHPKKLHHLGLPPNPTSNHLRSRRLANKRIPRPKRQHHISHNPKLRNQRRSRPKPHLRHNPPHTPHPQNQSRQSHLAPQMASRTSLLHKPNRLHHSQNSRRNPLRSRKRKPPPKQRRNPHQRSTSRAHNTIRHHTNTNHRHLPRTHPQNNHKSSQIEFGIRNYEFGI